MTQVTPELSLAVDQFVRQAVHSIMTASNPLMGTLGAGGYLPEGVTTDVVVQADGTSVASPAIALSHEVKLPVDRLRAGDLDAVHEVIAEIAEVHAEQFSGPLEDHFDKALDAVGNNLKLKMDDFTWDTVLDAYEKVEWLPVDGTVRQPQMRVGANVQAALERQGELTPEQRQRLQAIFERKQAEYVSRRRSRRLR